MTHTRFEDVIEKMPKYLQELKDCEVITRDERGNLAPYLPTDVGIYVFYENDEPMYVGRTNRLKKRLPEHGRPSSSPESASFAFNIAKLQFAPPLVPDSISKQELLAHIDKLMKIDKMSRKDLAKDPDFKPLFDEAKQRVKQMGIKVVEIEDPIEQTIFEVYAHLELGTPPEFNSFENH